MATRPPVYGQMSEFQSETESLKSYVERAKIFFAANEIPDDKQPAVFLSVIGGKTYALLRSLLAPDLPQDQTLEDIVAALESHFDPKLIVIAERFHFHRRNQLPNESVAVYVAELRRLSTHCDFREYLKEALRDRLVCGLRNECSKTPFVRKGIDLQKSQGACPKHGSRREQHKSAAKDQNSSCESAHEAAPTERPLFRTRKSAVLPLW